jgi:hypothetical protein
MSLVLLRQIIYFSNSAQIVQPIAWTSANQKRKNNRASTNQPRASPDSIQSQEGTSSLISYTPTNHNMTPDILAPTEGTNQPERANLVFLKNQ